MDLLLTKLMACHSSRHYCSAVTALSKPCGQGVLPRGKHCSAREAMHGAATQRWAWKDQIQDCHYLYVVLFPAGSRKTYGRGWNVFTQWATPNLMYGVGNRCPTTPAWRVSGRGTAGTWATQRVSVSLLTCFFSHLSYSLQQSCRRTQVMDHHPGTGVTHEQCGSHARVAGSSSIHLYHFLFNTH